ncbi:MAG: hypothetical protein H6732_15440 [Alphaproteobacteria bacterium]|nr:hypothetical protein [Alphaproteobacteria bacterium]
MRRSLPLVLSLVAAAVLLGLLVFVARPASTTAPPVAPRVQARALDQAVGARLLSADEARLPLSARMAAAEAEREAKARRMAEAAEAIVDELRGRAERFAEEVQLDAPGRRELARLVDAADRELLRWVRVVELGGHVPGGAIARFTEVRRRLVVGAETAWPEHGEAIGRHFPQGVDADRADPLADPPAVTDPPSP